MRLSGLREWLRVHELSGSGTDTPAPQLPRAPSTKSGSHRNWFNPATGRVSVLPDWGAKDLKLGTLRAALHQLRIEWEVFERA